MSAIIIFVGVICAILGLAWGKKWYTKLGAVVGGLTIAALPFIVMFVSQK